MKALILAAGEGKRLKPFTDTNPKCLLPFEGRSILDWQVDAMRLAGISGIICVKGHMADKIARDDIKYYVNDRYASTNMVETLFTARPEFTDSIVVSYGDILYTADVLKAVTGSVHDIVVAVDDNWESYWKARFEDPMTDAEALKMDGSGRISVIGQTPSKLSDIQAGYIGLIKFTKRGLDMAIDSYARAAETESKGGRPWGISRPLVKAYMTDMLQGLINEGTPVYAARVKSGWFEIDSIRDYELAKSMFRNGDIRDTASVSGRI
ncbi:MAG: phosphocholine cytidylyltransferase family protein [Candidatus Omnitrophota bacterium]